MSQKRVKVHLTGFGKFLNVIDNPSSQIITSVSASDDFLKGEHFEVVSTTIIDVSAVDTLQTLLRLQRITFTTKSDGDVFVYVHLGVHEKAKEINLEQIGKNLADFRGPDIRNFMPQNSPVYFVGDNELQCKLPLESLLEKISQLHPSITCKISQSAGEYVCNWI